MCSASIAMLICRTCSLQCFFFFKQKTAYEISWWTGVQTCALPIFREHEQEIGVRLIPLKEMVYLPARDRFEESDHVESGPDPYIKVSGTRVIEESLFSGKPLPEWFTFPEVARTLSEANPPKS